MPASRSKSAGSTGRLLPPGHFPSWWMDLSHFFILFIVVTMSAIQLFKCGKPCDRAFSDSRGLTHHRNNCSVYKQRQGAQVANAKAHQLKHQLEKSQATSDSLAELPRVAKRPRSMVTVQDDHSVRVQCNTMRIFESLTTDIAR